MERVLAAVVARLLGAIVTPLEARSVLAECNADIHAKDRELTATTEWLACAETERDAKAEPLERLSTFDGYLSKVGGGLKTAIDNSNPALSSDETCVFSQGRKIEELSESDTQGALPKHLGVSKPKHVR